MNISKSQTLLIFFVSFMLSSCKCIEHEIADIEFIKSSDKMLTCSQIEYELLDTKAKLALLNKQSSHVDAYSPSPHCFITINAKITRSIQMAEERIAYLNDIYNKKNCSPNAKNKLKNNANPEAKKEKIITKLPIVENK